MDNEFLKYMDSYTTIREFIDSLKMEDKKEEVKEPLYGGAYYDSNDEFKYITKVIYQAPATIVFWNDGTKTTSKCDDRDNYNPEMGLLIAVMKKITSGEFVERTLKDWTAENGQTRTLGHLRKEAKRK